MAREKVGQTLRDMLHTKYKSSTKSKKYRRIRKRQRERLKESALDAAMEDDEDNDLAKELQEKEEVARIQERMSLAHKNTSKWARRILKRGNKVDADKLGQEILLLENEKAKSNILYGLIKSLASPHSYQGGYMVTPPFRGITPEKAAEMAKSIPDAALEAEAIKFVERAAAELKAEK